MGRVLGSACAPPPACRSDSPRRHPPRPRRLDTLLRAPGGQRKAHGLRRRVADPGVPEDQCAAELLFRRVGPARRADPARSAGGRVRRGQPQVSRAPLPEGDDTEADSLRDQHARPHRPQVEPGPNPLGAGPYEAGSTGRDRRRLRSGRLLHADGAQEPRHQRRRAQERRQPRAGREGRGRQGRHRGSGRRVRLRHRRSTRARQGARYRDPRVGSAARRLRNRGAQEREARASGVPVRHRAHSASGTKASRLLRLRTPSEDVAERAWPTGKPAVAIARRLGLPKPGVGDLRVGRLLLDGRAVPECGLVGRVGTPIRHTFEGAVRKADGVMLARADSEDDPRSVSGSDDHVLYPGGSVDGHRLAGREHAETDPDLVEVIRSLEVGANPCPLRSHQRVSRAFRTNHPSPAATRPRSVSSSWASGTIAESYRTGPSVPVIERRLLRFEAEALSGLELPCVVASGAKEGPRLALIAGIHGCEYSSISAVIRFLGTLDTHALRGTVTAVPVVNLPSFRARTPFVSLQDGKNLNRCFPGSYEGTFSDALARAVFDELIAPSDVLIDLHGGDLVEALEPFALYDESPVEECARTLAISFGLPYVVRSPTSGGAVSGTTSSAAAAAGVPAVIAEAGGCGLLEEGAVQLHLDGLANALRHLGMLEG